MRKIVLTTCLALGACGGAEISEEEQFREAALFDMQKQCMEQNGSGVESWQWIDSLYPYGPMKGEVFRRGWVCTCAPNADGHRLIIPNYPPVI